VVAAEPLFHPLVTVETALHWIREVRADLQERGAPRAIVDVEVVVINGDGLARKIEHRRVAAALPLVRFEGAHLFLRDANHDDTFAGGEACAVRRHKGVLAVDAFERHERHVTIGSKRPDGGHKAVVAWLE
jgi:hypothetical protein